MNRGRIGLMALWLLAALPSLSSAQNGGQNGGQDGSQDARVGTTGPALQVRTLLGFTDHFRPGRWTPVTVDVSNRGDPVTGRLEVVTHDGDEFRRAIYPVVHHRKLELGRDARKRFHFTVYLESLANPLEVQVLSGDKVLASERLDLRHRFSPARQLLVLSRDADLDYLNQTGEEGLRVLYPHPDQLPRHWQGYDAVAAVIIHGLSLQSLDAHQFDALLRWIARGGVLAISGGPDYALLNTQRLATLLPATPNGLVAVTDPASAGAALGAPLQADKPFHVNRVGRIRGDLLHDVDGTPLVLQARRGFGRVLYLTFDVARYPFDRWTAMGDIWVRLLDVPPGSVTPVHQPGTPSTIPVLLKVHSQGFPGHGTLLLFIALYLSVLATAYRIRAATSSSRTLRWISSLAIPVVFAPAAFALFSHLLFQPGTHARVVAVVEPLPNSRFATVQFDVGIHSSHQDSATMEYTGASPAFRVPLEDRRHVAAEGWRHGARSLTPVERRAYTLHLSEGQDTIPFDLDASVSADEQLTVRNDSGHAIEDAWLVLRGSAWFLGTVAADARIEFDLSAPPDVVANDPDEWWPALLRDPRADGSSMQVAVEVLSRESDARGDRGYPGAGHALLMGYTGGLLRLRGKSADWRTTELSLVLLRFPARAPSAPPRDETNETT